MTWLRRASTAVVLAFFALALLPRATWPLIDPDVWWHIRAGEEVLDSGAIPRVDTWSLTAAGQPWTSQDWLSNVLLALGYRLGPWGMTLLSLAYALLAVVAFVILWRAIDVRRPQVGWLARVAWFSAALLLAGPVLGVRAQVVVKISGDDLGRLRSLAEQAQGAMRGIPGVVDLQVEQLEHAQVFGPGHPVHAPDDRRLTGAPQQIAQ